MGKHLRCSLKLMCVPRAVPVKPHVPKPAGSCLCTVPLHCDYALLPFMCRLCLPSSHLQLLCLFPDGFTFFFESIMPFLSVKLKPFRDHKQTTVILESAEQWLFQENSAVANSLPPDSGKSFRFFICFTDAFRLQVK